jgi:hypothetical protein
MKRTSLFSIALPSTKSMFSQIFVILALICTAFETLQAQAANPKISIQGTLKSASGSSVADGAYDVTFKLYSVQTGGTAVWEEDASVEVIGGIYSHYLGSITPLDPSDFITPLFLGVQVGSYELIPRTELAYSPYAFSVNSAQTVVCSGAVGDIKHSILNPAQFAAVNGACWVPMDGRPLAATDQLRIITGMANVPDGSGLFIRSQEFNGGGDNDPGRDSNSPIASVQQDDIRSHNHTMGSSGSHNHSIPYDSGGGGSGGNNPMLWFTNVEDQGTFHTNGAFANGFASTDFDGNHTHTINNTGGAETRSKNLNLWVYIRIN